MEVWQNLFLGLIAGFLGGLAGVWYLQQKSRRTMKLNQELLKSYMGNWIATGDNADMYDTETGTHYIDVPLVKEAPLGGWPSGNQEVRLCIPNIGHSPRYSELMVVRMRAPGDPQPPHWQKLGSLFFAESTGTFVANR